MWPRGETARYHMKRSGGEPEEDGENADPSARSLARSCVIYDSGPGSRAGRARPPFPRLHVLSGLPEERNGRGGGGASSQTSQSV